MSEIGDDLIEARDFVNTTIEAMDILLSDARLNIELAQSKLRDIQLDARTLNAKGIARAAKSVLDCYESGSSQPKIDGRLMALYKLVAQYTEGLNEIAPVISEESLAAQQESLETQHKIARETLIPLIKFSGDTAPALQRLAGLSVDVPAKISKPQMSFESLMSDVTNSALRAARTQGKSVSVSYATDGLSVAHSQVDAVRGQLEDIVTRLVNTHIASSDNRLAKGLPRGGHIDISAKDTAEGLDIAIECEGKIVTISPTAKNINAITDTPIAMTMEIGA